MQVRKRYPDAEMMMGIGNISELTDVDSAGVNTILLGICQELGIRSILTTQVINWARSSVKECDIARRVVHYAITNRVPPKHLETQLLTLRDPETTVYGQQMLDDLAASIKDPNYRLYAEEGRIHLVSAGLISVTPTHSNYSTVWHRGKDRICPPTIWTLLTVSILATKWPKP